MLLAVICAGPHAAHVFSSFEQVPIGLDYQATFSDYVVGLDILWRARSEMPGHVATTHDLFRHAASLVEPILRQTTGDPEQSTRVPAPKSTHLRPAKLIIDLSCVRGFATLSIVILRLMTR